MRGYTAENRVFKRRRTPILLTDARGMAAMLFHHFGVEHIEVNRARGGTRQFSSRSYGGSHYWHAHLFRPAWISIGGGAPDWHVCHEVAHHVATTRVGEKHGHGNIWAGIYVEAVRVAIGETYARRLLKAMLTEGLKPWSA
jgi:hypothetical protein